MLREHSSEELDDQQMKFQSTQVKSGEMIKIRLNSESGISDLMGKSTAILTSP